MCFDFGSQHLGCWGQNTSRLVNKEVYATLCLLAPPAVYPATAVVPLEYLAKRRARRRSAKGMAGSRARRQPPSLRDPPAPPPKPPSLRGPPAPPPTPPAPPPGVATPSGNVRGVAVGGDEDIEYLTTGPCPLRRGYDLFSIDELKGCMKAVDVLDGDLSCYLSVSVQEFPPDKTYRYARLADYSAPVKVNNSCIKRTVLATGTDELDCRAKQPVGSWDIIDPGSPLDTRYVVTYSAADAQGNIGPSTSNYVTWVVRAPCVLYGVKYIDLVSLGKKGARC